MHQTLIRYTDFISKASVQGRLYEITGYPGLVLSDYPTERVHGELYRIKQQNEEALFSRLDAYEECSSQFPQPHEYIREIITVATESGQMISAWCYLYNHMVTGCKLIIDGYYRPR